MNKNRKSVLSAVASILVWVSGTAPARAATIFARTAGFAFQTPDFYSVSFQAGEPAESISSVTFSLPFGFFNFDGDTSFMNATAPVLFQPSLSGLTPEDITFSFTGVNPKSLTVNFTPGSFGVGDSFSFAADVEGLGSKIGGVFGGVGADFSVTLGSGLSGSAPFITNTSVASSVTVTIEDSVSVPEPSTLGLLICGLAGLMMWRKRVMT